MSKYVKLYSPGTVLTGSAFKIYLQQRDETVITGGFEIGKIKIQGTGSAFDTQLSIGSPVIIGSIGGTQEVTVTRDLQYQLDSNFNSELITETETGREVDATSTTRIVKVPNRRIKYTVDSITSATEFITKSFETSIYDADSATTDTMYDKRGNTIGFDLKYPKEAGRYNDNGVTTEYGNTYISAYVVTDSSYINIDDIINYREDPNDSSKMIVILKNTIDPIWFHNQVEELDFMLNPDSGAGYDLFKPNLEVFDTSTAEGKRDKRRVTNRTGKPVSSSTSESRYSGRPNRY